MSQLKDINKAILEGNSAEAVKAVRQVLDSGTSPMDVIEKGVVAALDIVGKQYGAGEIFFPEMMLSAIAARESIAIAIERMGKGQYKPKATMLIGTVKGDLHDIGKNIVALVLRARGFDVIDLGVNVTEEKLVEAVKKYKPDFVGLSCLMTTTMMGMKDLINALTEAGLRNKVKVIVGGCPLSDGFAKQIGSDYCGRDAISTAVLLEEKLAEAKGKKK